MVGGGGFLEELICRHLTSLHPLTLRGVALDHPVSVLQEAQLKEEGGGGGGS
jgi:hypothetical protein